MKIYQDISSLNDEKNTLSDELSASIDSLICDAQPGMVSELKTQLKMKNPVCLVFGGESTVEVKGTGKGGRNQEMALAVAINLEKVRQFIKNVIFSYMSLSLCISIH